MQHIVVLKGNKMMKIRKTLICLLVFTILCTGLAATFTASAEAVSDSFYHGESTSTRIWKTSSDNGKYPRHRIPGIVITKKNTVIIYCEARTGDTTYSLKKANDWCLMDIYIQRSEDGGKTFGEPIYIAKGNSTTATVNNPVMIVGEDNTLHMLYCKNYSIQGGGIWYRYSTDDGLTWSPEKEMSEFVDVEHSCFAFGPTHGICTSDGTLMAPVWYVPAGEERNGVITEHGPSKAAVFYSKDNGKTWALGEVASGNSNESSLAELSDGSIMMNSRATPNRKVTTSPNGIDSWTTTYADSNLPDPGCCGSIISANVDGLAHVLLFGNCASSSGREYVTVKASLDDGKTWATAYQLSGAGVGGYVDLACDSTGKVYVLYEIDFGSTVRLATFSLVDELIDENELPLLTSSKTSFSFAEDEATNYVSEVKNLDSSINDGALHLTANNTKNYFVTFDFSSATKNINLSDYTAVVMKIRTNAANKDSVALGGYFLCSSTESARAQNLVVQSVKNDGEWQTVVFDLSSNPNIGGMLKAIKLEINSDTGRGVSGDWLEIASVEFIGSVDELNTTSEVTDTVASVDTQEQTNSAENEEEKSGCGASLSACTFLTLTFVIGSVLLLAFRKKKYE